MKKMKHILKYLATLFLVFLVSLCIYTFVVTDILKKDYVNVFGYTYFVVATGSMSGTIEVDDIIFVRVTKDVQVDDIVTYKNKDGNIITHRLINKNGDQYITKGDVNNIADEAIAKKQIIGKVQLIISPSFILKSIAIFLIVFILLALINFDKIVKKFVIDDEKKEKVEETQENEKKEVSAKESSIGKKLTAVLNKTKQYSDDLKNKVASSREKKALEKQRLLQEKKALEKQKAEEAQKALEEKRALEKQKEIEKQKALEEKQLLEKQKEEKKQKAIEELKKKVLERQKEREKQEELEKQKEIERQKEIEKQKALEEQQKIERQKEIEAQKALEQQQEIEKQKALEEKRAMERQKALASVLPASIPTNPNVLPDAIFKNPKDRYEEPSSGLTVTISLEEMEKVDRNHEREMAREDKIEVLEDFDDYFSYEPKRRKTKDTREKETIDFIVSILKCKNNNTAKVKMNRKWLEKYQYVYKLCHLLLINDTDQLIDDIEKPPFKEIYDYDLDKVGLTQSIRNRIYDMPIYVFLRILTYTILYNDDEMFDGVYKILKYKAMVDRNDEFKQLSRFDNNAYKQINTLVSFMQKISDRFDNKNVFKLDKIERMVKIAKY